ncbi:sensor histidine kinase [Kribbella sp. CA-293567]|uniref:sensor histidine kinase n=1 Tax=Kribbella sp. CA-293567 TaxID=3002436 RepID=UPI0022DE35B6|nr:histidine kinase [Kribbella sp. CA-293567]WBQ04023.1 histidine kinase [Kribbella sp. CA-293567]
MTGAAERRKLFRYLVADGVPALLCIAAMVVELQVLDQARPSVLAVSAIVTASLPLVLRRRAPEWALFLAMLTLFGVLVTAQIYNTSVLPAVLCAYALATRRGRRTALAAAALLVPVVIIILQTRSPHAVLSWDTARNLSLVALPLALGVATHERQAHTAALLERARTAERTREEEALRRVGQERLRIARDVHDVVAHAMVAINVQAGVGARLLDRNPEQARRTLTDIKSVSGAALNDLRSMLGVLRENDGPGASAPVHPTLDLDGLSDLRESLRSAGLDVDIAVDLGADGGALPATVGATGYRIVQEALTNVLRHTGPTSAHVLVTRHDDLVVFAVEDDGSPAGAPAGAGTGSGQGLRGMRERAAALGGSLEAGPRPGGGWRVAASLPIGAP